MKLQHFMKTRSPIQQKEYRLGFQNFLLDRGYMHLDLINKSDRFWLHEWNIYCSQRHENMCQGEFNQRRG